MRENFSFVTKYVKGKDLIKPKMASCFEGVEVGPKIEVFALTKAYQEDPNPFKVNLSVGGKLFASICVHYI